MQITDLCLLILANMGAMEIVVYSKVAGLAKTT